MQNVRTITNHERAWLDYQCSFGEKITWFSISQFQVITITLYLQMFIDIVEFKARFYAI